MDHPTPGATYLDRLSWRRVADLQAGGMRMLLLPAGATEQHGPHLPVNTDSVIAERLVAAASAATGVPMLPTLVYTVSAGHTGKWPGTLSLRHETFIHAVDDIVDWMAATGWERLLIVNSHFGNDAALRIAVDQSRLRHLGCLQLGMINTFLLSCSVRDYFFSDAEDLHANRAETDLMLHLAPDTVDMSVVEDDPDRTGGAVFSHPVSQTSLNGVTGTPSRGCATRGAELFAEMAAALTDKVRLGLVEEPPLPRSEWEGCSRLPRF